VILRVFDVGDLRATHHSEDLGVDGRIIIKGIFKTVWGRGLD
jgi:hypothetical protein